MKPRSSYWKRCVQEAREHEVLLDVTHRDWRPTRADCDNLFERYRSAIEQNEGRSAIAFFYNYPGGERENYTTAYSMNDSVTLRWLEHDFWVMREGLVKGPFNLELVISRFEFDEQEAIAFLKRAHEWYFGSLPPPGMFDGKSTA